jgi:very-short-patch-repair endonuclease
MFKCKICNQDLKNLKSLSAHIKKHKISSEEYYLKYIGEKGICSVCGKNTKFISIKKGYCKHCSYKCSKNSSHTLKKRQETCLKKYGNKNFFGSEIGKNKVSTSILKKYNVTNVMKNEEIKEKKKQTCLERYGYETPLQSEEIKNKIKNTMIEKYGVEYPTQNIKILKNIKNKHYKIYGVEYPTQRYIIKEKIKKTCLERYGYESHNSSNIIKEKKKETCLENYGVENIMFNKKIKEKIILSNRKKFYNSLIYSDRLKNKVKPNFSLNEYKGCDHNNKYSWICCKCNNEFKDHIDDGHIPKCPFCYPPLEGFSLMEKEISEFVKNINANIIENSRSIIPPLELDIYIPEKKLAIEFDGLYWHSEIKGEKNFEYHLNKTEMCEKKGVQLLHIFEDEWLNKRDIVESMIKSKLGKSKNRVYARKCDLSKQEFKHIKNFLEENHIQGYGTPAKINLCLYDFMELVAVMSFSKPRYNKNYDYEIIRYATKKNYSVIGGFSKLLKNFVKLYNPKNIISYADRRYSNGNVYLKCGFKKIDCSKPNYFYIEKDFTRSSRVKYQKHKLKNILETFDPNLTEWENMQLNNYDRIWDCGNLVFEYNC